MAQLAEKVEHELSVIDASGDTKYIWDVENDDEDTMLSQKIMLEHMEDHFREVANITYH